MSIYTVYAQYDLFSLLVMVILLIRTLTLSKSLTYQKAYILLMSFALIVVGSDLIFEIAEDGMITLPLAAKYAVNISYFVASILISVSWVGYTQMVTGIGLKKSTWSNIILYTPAAVLILAAFFTYYTKWVFYIDAEGYHRGSLNFLYMIGPLLYFGGACVMALFNAIQRKDKVGWDQFKTVFSFAIFPLISVAIQNIFIGFPAVCVGSMLGMLQVFLNDIVRDRELLLVAETTTKSKNNFFAGMSHELRTPINAIIGMNTMILRETDNDNIRNYATNVDNSGKLLLTLVNDILDISKIEAGKMKLVASDVDVKALIKDLYNMIVPRMKEKSLDFKVDIDPMLPTCILGDEVRIRQIILNILTNAVKYTASGSVYWSVKSDNRHDNMTDIIVSVKDTGRGMTPESIENLFSPYERIDEKVNRKIEGTGLGMSICKQLLDLMGSHMIVESEYGKGSTFSFTINVPVINIKPIGEVDIISDEPEEKKEKPKKYQSGFTAENARILCIDDTIVNLTVFKALLKTTRMKIDTATSGKEALELAKQNEYDMIFIDIMMPEMDGIETLARLFADKNLVKGNTPMIALTANALSGAKEEYLAAGFFDYLSKPIEFEKLEEMIIKYLAPDMVTYTR